LSFAGLAAVVLSGITGAAVADDGGRPNTDQAQATLTGETRTKVKQVVCQGADGEYREARETFRGTSTSKDPRLAGALTVTVNSFINRSPSQQEGTVSGRVVVREPGGRVKVDAHFDAVSSGTAGGDPAATIEGVLVGRAGQDRLFANFSGRFDAMDNNRDFMVTLGSAPATDTATNPAVLQRGACPGGPGAPSSGGDEGDN